jgi:DNA-directed RNA polymerase subunit RPC12/RpoP
VVRVELHQCGKCGRKFNEKAYEKHAYKCTAGEPKVKPQSMTEKRLAGAGVSAMEARQIEKKVKKDAKYGGKPKNDKWKNQSSALRDAMKRNRIISQAEKEGKDIRTLDLPPAPEAVDDRTPCPHCGRSFNALAAERHIPKCTSIKSKPSMLRAGGGTSRAAPARGTTRATPSAASRTGARGRGAGGRGQTGAGGRGSRRGASGAGGARTTNSKKSGGGYPGMANMS